MTDNNKILPLVSVIVPCYNSGIYLADALNSVLAQTYTNWECIILDDGSTDESAKAAKAYTDRDKRFRYIYQVNKGLPSARNAAIKNSLGKYILPLDADDKISSAYLSEAVSLLEKNRDIKLVYCRAELFGSKSGEWINPEYSYRHLLIRNLIFCSAIFRKEDFEKTRGYNEKMTLGFEDWEFWLTFLNENDKVFQLPHVYFYYRVKETSMRTELDMEKQKKLRTLIYNEHKELYDKYFTMPGLILDYYILNTAFGEIKKSGEYRAGKFILAPLRFIMKIFK